MIGIVPKQGDIYQPQVLAKIKQIQDELELLPHAVRHNILSLAARKVKQVRGGPEGMEVRPMMETVPQTPDGDRPPPRGGRVDADLHQRAGVPGR